MQRVFLLSLVCLVVMAGVAGSTTIIPPTFESLITAAKTIFVGEVVDVRAEWFATPQGRAIRTHVTFKVEEAWKGSVGAVTQLEFLGGTIGGTTMEVVGMPIFREGQRSVLFVSPEVRLVSPLVGFHYGRLRIERDGSGVDRVRTHDGRSLGQPSEVAVNRSNYRLSVTPMRLADLESAVRSRVLAAKVR